MKGCDQNQTFEDKLCKIPYPNYFLNLQNMKSDVSLSYRDAGVDIDAGNELVNRIKPAIKSTHRPGCIGSIGGFGGLFELPLDRYTNPLLVSGTDGVGTKLKLAIDQSRFDGIGIDLVAMCANDIAVLGAEALFFLDYYATGQLQLDQAEQVINGIAEGCRLAGCALIGGETAEMPGIYSGNDFDLAGFCVGIVEKSSVIDGSLVSHGDAIIAIASSGPHSNGYSLIRKVIETDKTDLNQKIGAVSLSDALLEPTRIYVKNLLSLRKTTTVKAIAHITGGGLLENIPRALPENCLANLELNSWTLPVVFQWLQKAGHIRQEEMFRTFNCGVGMILIVDQQEVPQCLETLSDLGETAWKIGTVEKLSSGNRVNLVD
ncbi:MAG: phosphoribosylformylglycinamidine cyclo-ligase [Gammaproteobacteria bacterium]|jgi:phosphoribosylformylglycinamidine cyclo-ligase